MTSSVWTPELVQELTKLWSEGHSTSEIGRRLGITKNSVVGKARRIDLAMRRKPAQKKIIPKVITMDRLRANMCSWPMGDPGTEEFRFCGAEAVPGKPYCADHCAVAYIRGSGDKKRPEAA